MDKKFETFWTELVGKYRRSEGLMPTADELDEEISKVTPEPLSETEICRIVSAVSSGDTESEQVEPDLSWLDSVDTSSVAEGVLQLNRNKGPTNDEVEQRLRELRRKALGENDGEDDVESD